MLDIKTPKSLSRERALANAIKQVVAELRLVDVVDYVAFLRLEQHGNVADLVSSSAELYLKPGVLRYADQGAARLSWGTVPVVELALEFRHAGVTAHFQLELGASTAAIDILYLAFDDSVSGPEEETGRLLDAIADAHLVRGKAKAQA